MDLTKLSMSELLKLYSYIGFELLKRIWWVIFLIAVVGIIITYLQLISSNITRSGVCSECKKHHIEKSRFEFIANLKFNLWLYKHCKKEHNENILITFIKSKINKFSNQRR